MAIREAELVLVQCWTTTVLRLVVENKCKITIIKYPKLIIYKG